MISCIVIDDEIGAIDILTDYIQRSSELKLAGSYLDPIEAIKYLTKNDIDLMFLDIDMPGLDGLQVSELMRTRGILTIFCTAYSRYAVESYEYDAVDYLLKPIPFDRFSNAVAKAKQRIESVNSINNDSNKSSHIFIKSGTKYHQVDINELLYMKKDGHYIDFVTSSRKYLSRLSMSELLENLPTDDFIRIHRSYVVALGKIEVIEKYFIIINNQKIPIGDSYRDSFFERINYTGN